MSLLDFFFFGLYNSSRLKVFLICLSHSTSPFTGGFVILVSPLSNPRLWGTWWRAWTFTSSTLTTVSCFSSIFVCFFLSLHPQCYVASPLVRGPTKNHSRLKASLKEVRCRKVKYRLIHVNIKIDQIKCSVYLHDNSPGSFKYRSPPNNTWKCSEQFLLSPCVLSSAEQEWQAGAHHPSQPTRAPDWWGCSVHRLHPTHTVCGLHGPPSL